MKRFIELSHVIEDGMATYPGLPPPRICDFWTREASRAHFQPGTEFQIGRIEMVANTGTYIDAPFHRYADGVDLADLDPARFADLPGLVVHAGAGRVIDADSFAGIEPAGHAVLVHTGWSRHFGTPAYFDGHPFLTEAAAELLRDGGAALVGIDSLNIDDTSGGVRPVHSLLLAAGIPIVEHLTALDQLPADGFRFSASPARFRGLGSFPVRALARIDGDIDA